MVIALSAGGCVVGPAMHHQDAARQARIDQAVRRVLPPGETHRVTVYLSADGAASAYAWPDGRIVLTRRLVDLLDEQALAAVIAHEVGHLLLDGHLSFDCHRGETPADDAELAADLVGSALLRQQSDLSPDAMARMLSVVRQSGDVGRRAARRLDERIARLQAAETGGTP